MTIKQPFVMEVDMGKYEQYVDFNLAESGVHPVLLRELLGEDKARLDLLLDTDLASAGADGSGPAADNIEKTTAPAWLSPQLAGKILAVMAEGDNDDN